MRAPLPLTLALPLALACKPTAEDCVPGGFDCACAAGACHPGLVCSNDVCIYGGASASQGDATDVSASADASSSATSGTGADAESGGDTSPTQRAVDLLFVIDNSGSMAEEQATLAANINVLVEGLDDAGVDWRIGITTTDNGNPWCNGTSPEAGTLRFTSCRSRTQEFIFNGAMMVDATQEACLDICPFDAIDVEPTPTDVDPTPSPRPWLESTDGVLNTSEVATDVLRCTLPQGINGCGFEQHLESMYKGIRRFENADEDSYGFARNGGLLAVVIVSDETDCSHNDDWSIIFLPMENMGNEVFWSDPDNQSSPTSAACWNAGVSCTGNGSPYAECHAADKDVDGADVAAGAAETDAVLHPLSRYADELSARPTYVAAIDGVPEGYEDGNDLVFRISLDAQDQLDFGIGPACETVNGKGVPSVRVRELVESQAGGERNNFSICAADHGPALASIVERIVARLP